LRCDACGAETTIARLLEPVEQPRGKVRRLCPACRRQGCPTRTHAGWSPQAAFFAVAFLAWRSEGANGVAALLMAAGVVFAGWLTLVVHELAHAVPARWHGAERIRIRLGREPAWWSRRLGGIRWSLGPRFHRCGACQSWLDPGKVDRRVVRDILIGPRVLHALLALALGAWAIGAHSTLCGFLCAWQVVFFLRTLVQYRGFDGTPSDGAQLDQLALQPEEAVDQWRRSMVIDQARFLHEAGRDAELPAWIARHRALLAADGRFQSPVVLMLEHVGALEEALAWCERTPAAGEPPEARAQLARGEPDPSRALSFHRVRLLLLLDRPDDALALARANLAAATSPEEEALRRCDVIDGLLVRDEPDACSVREAMAQAGEAWAVLPWAPMVAICRAMALGEGGTVDEALAAAGVAGAVVAGDAEPAPLPVLAAYRAIALWRGGRTAEARSRLAGWDPSHLPPPLVRRVARITAD